MRSLVATMITLRKSEVPEYLKQGELYRTLIENNDDPDGGVTFPVNVLKPDTSISEVEDCERLLESLRFWGVVTFVPQELVAFVLASPVDVIIEAMERYASAFKYIQALFEMLLANAADRVRIAIRFGVLEIVKCLRTEEIPADACVLAAEMGDLDIIKWVCKNGSPWNEIASLTAARHGHTHVLQYFHYQHDCNVDSETLRAAVVGGHLDCIQFVCSVNVHPAELLHEVVVATAAKHGHVHLLKHFEHIISWEDTNCHTAAKAGHLNCLQFLHEHGSPWDDDTTSLAAKAGHLDCLMYLHEHDCLCDSLTCQSAAKEGQLACLRYLHEQGCPWDKYTCIFAAGYGHLNCLQYAHEHGCAWDESAWEWAAGAGHLNCLQYFHEQGCEWDGGTCHAAASTGQLECLQYAVEHGCAWDTQAVDAAVDGGHLSCLVYLHAQGGVWSDDAASRAAADGHVDCLQYLRANGCPMYPKFR